MDDCEVVEVFNYLVFDVEAQGMRLSKHKATPHGVSGLGGRVLEGTSEWVARADLDRYRRFCRVATGWISAP